MVGSGFMLMRCGQDVMVERFKRLSLVFDFLQTKLNVCDQQSTRPAMF